jgi:transposase
LKRQGGGNGALQLDPHGGALFVFRGRRGDLLRVLWWDGQGLCLFAKRLERGRFLWPQAKDGSVVLTVFAACFS